MKKKLLAVFLVLMLTVFCLLCYSYLNRGVVRLGTDRASIPVSELSGSEISSTPPGVTIRFEAVIMNRDNGKCLELFTPDEFEKYGGDPKWAISSKLGFEPGLFDRLQVRGKAIVNGRYILVKDVHDGPCGVVTGHLFEINEIEYPR